MKRKHLFYRILAVFLVTVLCITPAVAEDTSLSMKGSIYDTAFEKYTDGIVINLHGDGLASAWVVDKNGEIIADAKIEWSVSKDGIIDYEIDDESGFVTIKPVSPGVVMLNAVHSSLIKTFTIEVVETEFSLEFTALKDSSFVEVTEISLSMESPRQYLEVTLCDQFGTSFPADEYGWSIEPTNVIELEKYKDWYGETVPYITYIHPKETGNAELTVSVTKGGETISKTLPVAVQQTTLSLKLDGTEAVSVDGWGWVDAVICDQFGNTFSSDETIVWTVSDGITLDKYTGDSVQILPQREGEAEVTATIEGTSVSKTFSVTVVPTERMITIVEGWRPVDVVALSMYEGTSISAEVEDQFERELENDPIRWEIVDGSENISINYDPDKSGKLTITPKAIGAATIQAVSVNDNSLSAEVKVQVVDTELYIWFQDPNTMVENAEQTLEASVWAKSDDPYIDVWVDADITWEIVSGTGVLEDAEENSITLYVPIEEGTTAQKTITVRVSGMGVSDDLQVTVFPESETERHVESIWSIPLSKNATGLIPLSVYDQFGNMLRGEKATVTYDSEIFAYSEIGDGKVPYGLLTPKTTSSRAEITLSTSGDSKIVPVIVEDTLVSGCGIYFVSDKAKIGETIIAWACAVDQYGNLLFNEELTLLYDAEKLQVEKTSLYGIPVYFVTPLVEGEMTISATVTNHPEFTEVAMVSVEGVSPLPYQISLDPTDAAYTLYTGDVLKVSADAINPILGTSFPVTWDVESGEDLVELTTEKNQATIKDTGKSGEAILSVSSPDNPYLKQTVLINVVQTNAEPDIQINIEETTITTTSPLDVVGNSAIIEGGTVTLIIEYTAPPLLETDGNTNSTSGSIVGATVEYKELGAETEKDDGVKLLVTLQLDTATDNLPVLNTEINQDVNAVAETSGLSLFAMVTATSNVADINEHLLKSGDLSTIVFTVPTSWYNSVDEVWSFHYKEGKPVSSEKIDAENIQVGESVTTITLKITGFSTHGIAGKEITADTTGSSSIPQGSSVWLTSTETPDPTPSETPDFVSTDIVPTDISGATPTEEPKSSFGVFAVLAGLGAVAALRRK